MKLNTVKDIIDNISVIENVGCGYASGCGNDADDGINQLMVKSLVDDFGVDEETARDFCKSGSESEGEANNEIIVSGDRHIYCLTVYWTATDIKYDLTRGKFVAMMTNGYEDCYGYGINEDEVRFRYRVDGDDERYIDIVQKGYTELAVAKDDDVLGMDFFGDATYKMYHFKRFFNDANDIKEELDLIISDIKKRMEMMEDNAYRRFRADLLKIDCCGDGDAIGCGGAFTVDVKAMMRDMQFANVEKANDENTINI